MRARKRLIRNVETLEYVRMAPIFDSGNGLWCQTERLETARDYEYVAKPFGRNGMTPERQLKLLTDFSWFAFEKLEGFEDEVCGILSQNQNMSTERIQRIRRGILHQISIVGKQVF